MTFGALAAWQAWLLLAGAAAVAAALFLIKLRPPRVIVASTLIWRKVLDDSRELTLWERIRRAVSLVVTVLIAIAVALALARPGRIEGAAGIAKGRLLIVVDSSWSMAARTSGGETRWERAIAEAHRLAAGASGGEIAIATTADGLVEGPTADGTLVDSAIERLEPGGGRESAWPRLAGATSVHFITDGATPRSLDASVVVHSVHEPADNAAIVAFDVRPSLSGTSAGDAYLEIANYSSSAQKVRLVLTRGTSTIFDNELDVDGAASLRQVVPIPRGGDAALTARISARANALDVDDQAVAWLERAQPIRVTVVGARTEWLRAAFERNPDVRATFVAPAAYRPRTAGEAPQDDVVVFDKWAPQDAPRQPAILFAPPLTTTWLTGNTAAPASGAATFAGDEMKPRWESPGTHPVVDGVDPFTLTIERTRGYTAPSLHAVARSARGMPLVSIDDSTSARLVVVGFSADESNLAGAPGFPVLLGNALDWLTRPAIRAAGAAQGAIYRPGVATFDRGVDRVVAPSGDAVRLTRLHDRVVGLLREPGLYTIEGGGAASRIAVNAGDAQLSNLGRTTRLGSGDVRTVGAGASGRPWWLYCAAIAFVLALAEWWTWQRRITV